MKLIMAIVNKADSKAVIKNLMANGFQVTKLASSGGFLKAGNVTLLCGMHNEGIDKCLKIIEATCKAKTYTSKNLTPESNSLFDVNKGTLTPCEIVFGGATVFVLNVEKSVKY